MTCHSAFFPLLSLSLSLFLSFDRILAPWVARCVDALFQSNWWIKIMVHVRLCVQWAYFLIKNFHFSIWTVTHLFWSIFIFMHTHFWFFTWKNVFRGTRIEYSSYTWLHQPLYVLLFFYMLFFFFIKLIIFSFTTGFSLVPCYALYLWWRQASCTSTIAIFFSFFSWQRF